MLLSENSTAFVCRIEYGYSLLDHLSPSYHVFLSYVDTFVCGGEVAGTSSQLSALAEEALDWMRLAPYLPPMSSFQGKNGSFLRRLGDLLFCDSTMGMAEHALQPL